MTTENTHEKVPLTPEDPVDLETLAQFELMQQSKQELALVLVRIEQDKLEVLRSIARLDDQNRRLFESILVDRGLPPTTRDIEIDSKTGKLIFKGSKSASAGLDGSAAMKDRPTA